MFERLTRFISRQKEVVPAEGYDLWSQTYDTQPDNLMLALDEILFSSLLGSITLQSKNIIDVGCGTGRHWNKLFAGRPDALTGYDVSEGMMAKLKLKYPQANVIQLKDNHLSGSANTGCDLLISTLTIAHIENLEDAFAEWSRVLKKNADIIITDYHPELLTCGGNRTFRHQDRTISLKNYIHPIKKILETGNSLGWEPCQLTERRIDESVQHYYEQQNALSIFEKFRGTPVIFGMRLKNKYAIT